MKDNTLVGVYLDTYLKPSTLPNNPLCLCLEHQDTDLPRAPFKFPINALQAYYTNAHCAICGKYLGLPESQAPEKRPAFVDSIPRERVAALSEDEMRLLVTVLRRLADYFGGRVCDDIDFARLVSDSESRRQIMQRFHEWNGDPESFREDETAGRDYPYWTYSSALAYFAFRLAPDMEQHLREQERETNR